MIFVRYYSKSWDGTTPPIFNGRLNEDGFVCNGMSSLQKLLQLFDEMKHAGEPIECAICLEDIREGDCVFRMQCNHLYHIMCVTMWTRVSSECPLCKQEIKIKN